MSNIDALRTNTRQVPDNFSKDDAPRLLAGFQANTELVGWHQMVKTIRKLEGHFKAHEEALKVLCASPEKERIIADLTNGLKGIQRLRAACFAEANKSSVALVQIAK